MGDRQGRLLGRWKLVGKQYSGRNDYGLFDLRRISFFESVDLCHDVLGNCISKVMSLGRIRPILIHISNRLRFRT